MDTLEDILFQQLAFACSETKQSFDRYTGVNQTRRQLLTTVDRAGEISHAALQQQLALDGAAVTRLVKQFEADGVLRRRTDPQDNRYTLITLTDAGHAVVARLRAAHRAFQARLLADISEDEKGAMVHTLERLRATIRAVNTFEAAQARANPERTSDPSADSR